MMSYHLIKGDKMKQYIMPIHTKHGATVVTPSRFALATRCERLKRELKANKNSPLSRIILK